MENIINEQGIAIVTGEIQLYDFNQETGEFNGKFVYKIPQWTGIPAHSTIKQPPAAGPCEVARFDTEKEEWELVPDYRGKACWRVDNRAEGLVKSIGEVVFPYTLLKPASEFDKWDGEKWVTDMDAYREAESKKTAAKIRELLRDSETVITPLKDLQSMDMLSDAEYRMMIAWVKYRQSLFSVDKVNPVWPDEPSMNPGDYPAEDEGE